MRTFHMYEEDLTSVYKYIMGWRGVQNMEPASFRYCPVTGL